MKMFVKTVLWSAGLMMGAIGLTACGSEESSPDPEPVRTVAVEAPAVPTLNPTVVPTDTPEPTATPMPTSTPAPAPTATPVPAPATAPEPAAPADSSTATGDEVEERVRGYAEQCGALVAPLAADPFSMGESSPLDITWGQIADIADMNLESYRQLEPPPELEEFHRIRLETLEAFRDNARSRDSSGFVMVDLQEMLMAVFPQLMEMGLDPNKTDEEKEAVAQELILQELGKVYGEEFAAGLAAEDQVTSRLPSNLQKILDESGCAFSSEASSELPPGPGV